jgi:hypothetical protein
MSVETKLRNLISEINETTGKNDADLSKAVASLKKGYLGDTMLQTKRVNVTTNGSRVITPDEGYNALSQVVVTTSVTEEEIEEGFHAYYVEYDPAVADYRKVWICKVNGGEVITVKDGADVPESNVGTKDYNPALKFAGWSCPLAITNNRITVPDVICADVYIGAVYDPADNKDCYVAEDGSVYNSYDDIPLAEKSIVGIYLAGGIASPLAMQQHSKLTRITLPLSVTSIPSYTFVRLSEIKAMVLPSNVSNVGTYAMYRCVNLETLVLPYSLVTISDYALSYTYSLTTILFPPNVVAFSNNVLYYSRATGINVEAPIATSYGVACFAYTEVEVIKVPIASGTVNADMLLSCNKLEKIYSEGAIYDGRILILKSNLIAIAGTIDEAELSGYTIGYFSSRPWSKIGKLSTTSQYVSSGYFITEAPRELYVTDEGSISSSSSILTGNGSISEYNSGRRQMFKVGGNTRSFSGPVFRDGIAIVEADFPLAESVSAYMLYGCSNLKKANFPKATAIYTYAFYNCSKLREYDFSNVTSVDDHGLYGTHIKYFDFSKITSLASMSMGLTDITEVNAPLLESITGSCFQYCRYLKKATFARAKTVGGSAFYAAPLAEINLPSVESISKNAFTNYGTSLFETHVKCGKSLTTIAEYAFGDSSSDSTSGGGHIYRNSHLYIEASTPPTLGGKLAYKTAYIKGIYVPIGHEEKYKSAANWSTYASVIKPLDYLVDDSTIAVTFVDADGNVVGSYTHTEKAGSKNTSIVLTKASIEANASGYTADEQTITYVDGETKEVTVTVTK